MTNISITIELSPNPTDFRWLKVTNHRVILNFWPNSSYSVCEKPNELINRCRRPDDKYDLFDGRIVHFWRKSIPFFAYE